MIRSLLQETGLLYVIVGVPLGAVVGVGFYVGLWLLMGQGGGR